MNIIKPLKQSLLHKVYEHGGKCYLANTIISFFRFNSRELISEIDLWKFVAEQLGKDAILDMCMPKPVGEVLVVGKCFSPSGKPVPAYKVKLSLGQISKELYILGNRFWKKSNNGLLTVTDPEPFISMDISWENAFGGAQYHKNPRGKGFAPIPGPSGELIHPLPNIEDPESIIGSPKDRPEPMCFAPIDQTWPQRFSKVGTYDEKWRRERFPGLADDIDWTFFNAAQPDQWISGYFKGDEAFEIAGMHSDKVFVQSRLPHLKSRCFIHQKTPDGAIFKEIETKLDTVWLFPRAEKGLIIYRGVAEVQDDEAADVDYILVGYERMDRKPRPIEHYAEAFRKRTDDPKAYMYWMNESDLMPEGEKSAYAIMIKESQKGDEKVLENNLRRKAQRELDKNREMLKNMGLNPDDFVPKDVPAPQEDITFDKIGEMDVFIENKMSEAEAARKTAEAQLRENMKSMGLDYDQVLEEAKKQGGGVPKFSAEESIAMLGMVGMKDPETEARLREAEKRLKDAYRQFAQEFAEATTPPDGEKTRLREFVIAGYKAGKSFTDMDLTGVDLSNLSLPNINLNDAFMEKALLSGTDLSGARLERCVLARSTIANSKFVGARMKGVNLGASKISDSDFSDAELVAVVLAKANVINTIFTNAKMDGANLMQAMLAQNLMDKVSLAGALLMETDLSGCRLAASSIAGGNFMKARIRGTDFSGATLNNTSFIESDGEGAIFRNAVMTSACGIKDTSFAGADFSGARLERAGFRGINLEGSKFVSSNLFMADLSESNLKCAILHMASAKLARFMNSNLEGADLSNINMFMGSLRKARLVNADLSDSNLYSVEFFRATLGNTRLNGANLKKTVLAEWTPK